LSNTNPCHVLAQCGSDGGLIGFQVAYCTVSGSAALMSWIMQRATWGVIIWAITLTPFVSALRCVVISAALIGHRVLTSRGVVRRVLTL
jgi:hypothetical protein